jgi:predicted  nucleic acid-binding Zn-ribbon protein
MDRTTTEMTRFEAEKNTLDERWKSTLEDYNKMKKSFDDEHNKNTALLHEITTHQRHLQELDRQLKTLASEKQHANSTLTQIKGELAETKRVIHTHEQTIAIANNKIRENEQEITKLQGKIRVHEQQAGTNAAELKRLQDVETLYKTLGSSESDQLKTARDQIKQKDDVIRNITIDLGNTKSDLSKVNGEYQKLRKTVDDEVKMIERLTDEKKYLLTELDRLNSRTSYVAGPARILPQTTFSRRTGRRGPPDDGGGDDGDYDDTYQHAPHDPDDHGDQASVHFAYLLARLRGLVGEEPSIELVENLVRVLEHHITTEKARQALLKRIIPGYTPSRQPMSFHAYLYDYLLQYDSSPSIHHQLRRLREEGNEDGIQV